MSVLVWAMVVAGLAALVAGLIFVRDRLRAASGVGKVILLGPVFEAVAVAMFAAEHFLDARELMPIVPRWLPYPLFWTYFFGVALAAAAISLIVWRWVRWSAVSLALFFLIIVATVSLPGLPQHLHERLFWTLTVREAGFGCGAVVLAGSLWGNSVGRAVVKTARAVIATIAVFYAIQHFLFPRFVPGVPLEKLTPGWMPAATPISYVVGATLLAAGIGLLFERTVRVAAASAGFVLVLLTVMFYVPIFISEMHGALALEGINYVGDTLLYAATMLLAGYGAKAADA